ncbi:unnamed protein product [Fraxinus pennsylvanica]|uniref:Uncharacterized protein n=1 Tax=Fraxinus pennsylvanica TaxID=56036 RepID=A0AAD2DI06_9LAMI|nr:unnamed protein product [Fraxinus pennsylvanica]
MKNDSWVNPNEGTFVSVLAACSNLAGRGEEKRVHQGTLTTDVEESHAGMMKLGLKYFDMLLRDECIEVRDDHDTSLVDLCGRARRLKEAYDLIKQLPNKISAGVWGALLARMQHS